MLQESKLSSNSKTPSIQNFTTVRKDHRQGQGGGLLTLIHKSINFSRKPESPETLVEPHLEELTITATLGDMELIITNVYIPPASSCTGGYLPSLDHLMMTTDTLIGSKRHILQAVELSQWFQVAMQIVSNLPAPSIGGPIYRFLGMRTRWMAGAAAHKSG